MENEDVSSCIKTSTLSKETDIHKQTAVSVERLMKETLIKKSMDNITVVMIAFSGFERMNSPGNYEENRKPDLDYSPQSAQHKTALSASLLNPSDRLINSQYTPLGNRAFTTIGNDRQLFSATAKRYDALTNSMDYSGISSKGPYWRGGSELR